MLRHKLTLISPIIASVLLTVGCEDTASIMPEPKVETSSEEQNQTTVLTPDIKQIKIADINNQEVRLGHRVALLIANADYEGQTKLNNPVNDATLLAQTLNEQGFLVTLIKNSDRAKMILAIDEFAKEAKNAESAVFYYSGHGMQDDSRENYLLPVDAQIQSESSIKAFGVSTYGVIDALEDASPRASLVILDACRDNPFLKVRGTKGLADMNVTTDSQMLVSYATRSGQYAYDNSKISEHNSPYALAINEALKQADQKPLMHLLDDVADRVQHWTDNAQKPTRSGPMRVNTLLVMNDEVENTLTATPPSAPTNTATISRPKTRLVSPDIEVIDPPARCIGDACFDAKAQRLIFSGEDSWLTEVVDDALFNDNEGLAKHSSIERYLEAMINESIKENMDDDGSIIGFGSEYDTQANLVYQNSSVIVIEVETYLYAGGAHGMHHTEYLNVDRDDLYVLQSDDIFVAGSTNELTQILFPAYSAWLKKQGVEKSEITSHQKTFPFFITKNFRFTTTGIELIYHPYELGAYAMGGASLAVPYSQLEGILRPKYLPN